MNKIRIPKSEIRNKFEFLSFDIVSNFDIRISNFKHCSGQALITLLFFVLISVTITSAAIIVIILNAVGITKTQEGTTAYYAAESGIENAFLSLLRNPNYAGETLTVGISTVEISVTGVNPKTVISVGQNGNFKRTIQADMNYNNGYYTFSNWKEI